MFSSDSENGRHSFLQELAKVDEVNEETAMKPEEKQQPQSRKFICFIFVLLLMTVLSLGGVSFVTYKMHNQLKMMSEDLGYAEDGTIEEDESVKNSGGFKEKI